MKLIFSALVVSITWNLFDCDDSCRKCPHFHPQQIFCNSKFVGIVEITDVNLNGSIELPSSYHNVTAQATIKQIYKGEYQDFVVGSSIYVFAPNTPNCRREFWKGEFLMSGESLDGGLLTTKCDLMKLLQNFKPRQLAAIESHIHMRTYERGCQSCTIKWPYDYSIVQRNQCRFKYKEFPISTSVCVMDTATRRCSFQNKVDPNFVLPSQPSKSNLSEKRDFVNPETGLPQEGSRCLLDRIIENKAKVTDETTTTPAVTTMKSFFLTIPNSFLSPRMKIRMDWSKVKYPSWVNLG